MSYEIQVETVLTIRKDGELVGVFETNMKKRSQVFVNCKEGGQEDIKLLLEEINKKN